MTVRDIPRLTAACIDSSTIGRISSFPHTHQGPPTCPWQLLQATRHMMPTHDWDTLRASHTSLERDSIVSSFNDEKSTLQILVTSLRVGATSYNLQKSCNHLICLDVLPAANVALQAIGRAYRIGQRLPVIMFILTVDLTYDQVGQAKASGRASYNAKNACKALQKRCNKTIQY